MLLIEVATKLDMTPERLEQDSLRAYLERKLRVTESELFSLARRYGVRSVFELDRAIQAGRFHEPEAFEDYFRFDYLENEQSSLRELLAPMSQPILATSIADHRTP